MKPWLLAGAFAFLIGLPTAKANVHNFSYYGPGVTASGQLTTTSYGSYEVVTGINNGFRNGDPITVVPTGQAPGVVAISPDGRWAYDNLLWVSGVPWDVAGGPTLGPSFDNWGLLFEVHGVDTTGYVNVYDNPYTEGMSQNGSYSSFIPLDHISAAPEPGFYGVLALGLSGLFVGVRRRRRA